MPKRKRKSKQTPVVKVKSVKKSKKVLGSSTANLVNVRSAVDPDVRFFVASEQSDDLIVADELAGKMVDQCVYQFENKGQKIQGLTIVGVREAMRLINRNPKSGMKLALDHSRMFVSEETFNGEKGVLVKCYAYDHVSGAGNWGIKFETFTKHGKNGAYQDTFVMEKATSKAIRNAIAGLLPVAIKVRMIDTFVKKGSVAQLTAPKVLAPKAPIKDVKASTPDQLSEVIMKAIEKSEDPEVLHGLANKVEHTPRLSANQKQVLMNAARNKANTIIDLSIKE